MRLRFSLDTVSISKKPISNPCCYDRSRELRWNGICDHCAQLCVSLHTREIEKVGKTLYASRFVRSDRAFLGWVNEPALPHTGKTTRDCLCHPVRSKPTVYRCVSMWLITMARRAKAIWEVVLLVVKQIPTPNAVCFGHLARLVKDTSFE